MARNKSEKQIKGIESGDIYVAPGGQTFTMPTINADLIKKYCENKYIVEGLNKQQRILFKKRYTIHLFDTAEQEPEPKGTASLKKMCSQPDVWLWYTIQRMHRNVVEWGPAPYNPVWGYVGQEYQLLKLRDLSPETFSKTGTSASYYGVKNRILPGISLNDTTGEIEFHQTQRDGTVKKLENVSMMVDPICSEIGGTSFILPLIPIVSMIKHGWKRQMQILNKLGIFFIKVTDPQGDDKAFAQKIMRNVSTDVGFQLRGNMEVIQLGIGTDGSALPTITELGMQVRQFFSPSEIISKDGTLIGGSSNPEFDLYMGYIEGTHRWLEDEIEYILKPYLIENGFDDRYEIRVEIPDPEPDKSEEIRGLAETAFRTRSASINERRQILSHIASGLGVTLNPLTPEEQTAMEEEFARLPSSSSIDRRERAFQKARIALDAMKVDDLDPYALISKKQGRQYIQQTLGIEDGET